MSLTGRVAIVTGAGRGVGREHALLLAERGAKIVVNDLGSEQDGSGNSVLVAQQVVDEILATGGEAVANADNVASFEGAQRLVRTALDTFGDLDVLVNNAGILRDRMLVNMTEDDWDAIMAVHLKGHFAPTRHALAYWRERSKAGHEVRASVINTSSVAGLANNFGQTNYGAAKAGIATLTMIAAMESARYGVRVNAIAPVARTRMTLASPGGDDMAAAASADFDALHPGCISPLVAYLADTETPVTGGVFHVVGNQVGLFTGWQLERVIETEGRFSVEELASRVPGELLDGVLELPSSRLTMTSFQEILQRLPLPVG
jgi:NAD(P)-dependent dehydrogenase (short-subunit alcohol dehydrogenase family)